MVRRLEPSWRSKEIVFGIYEVRDFVSVIRHETKTFFVWTRWYGHVYLLWHIEEHIHACSLSLFLSLCSPYTCTHFLGCTLTLSLSVSLSLSLSQLLSLFLTHSLFRTNTFSLSIANYFLSPFSFSVFLSLSPSLIALFLFTILLSQVNTYLLA